MIKIFSFVIILSGFLHMTINTQKETVNYYIESSLAIYSREEYLWCYDCNTDLKYGYKGDCNDPYIAGALDLVACPRNESHHCHKSIILYKNILVTVRACVSSRQINEYCNYGDSFPHLNIECYFCKQNACNDKGLFSPMSEWYLGFIVFILLWILM